MSLQADNYENVVDLYSNMIYRLAFSYTKSKDDSEDIYQEVFLQYLKNGKEFENEDHRKAWLVKVTVNCCRKLWHSPWRRKMISLEEEIKFEMKEEELLYQEIEKLPKDYRLVIHLFYYEDYSIKQISQVLHRKESTVRTQLTRARSKLKGIIKEEDFFV